MTLDEAIQIAINKLGKDLLSNLTINHIKSDSFRIHRNGNEVFIHYVEIVDIFRALTLVKEKNNETSFDIILDKKFSKNGLMVDCSRNGVVNIPSIKNLIEYLALMGENRLLLYTEDTYELKKYPYFGYLRGAYTKEEIKEIVDYASGFGVDVVPCIQTLGHLERFLHWRPSMEIKDGPNTLLINEDKTYEFIEECIKFCRECFTSKKIHIGMDESTEIGLGRYLKKHDYCDRKTLFLSHLSRVMKICEKYEFEPMIWSDMFFRLNSSNEDYYRDEPLPDSTLKLIPNGIELVYWDYYHSMKVNYDEMNTYHKQTNREVSFAGGSWRWKGFAPSIEASLRFSEKALESCIEKNIESVFVTAWGDNGNECTVYSSLPVMAMFSTFGYFGKCSDEMISSLLKAITGDSLETFLLMDIPDRPDNRILGPEYNPSKYFLYQDPLNGIFDNQAKAEFKDTYLKHSITLKNASKISVNFGYVYETLSLLCKVLVNKTLLGVNLRKAYKNKDFKELKTIIKSIDVIIKDVDKLNESERILWNKENKSFGFDVIDGRSGYLKNRLISTKKIVKQFISGKINEIPELETVILGFDGSDQEASWNLWNVNVTNNCL